MTVELEFACDTNEQKFSVLEMILCPDCPPRGEDYAYASNIAWPEVSQDY